MHPLYYLQLLNTSIIFMTLGFCSTCTADGQIFPDSPPTISHLIFEMSRESSVLIIVYEKSHEYSAKTFSDITDDHQLLLLYEDQSFFGFLPHHMKLILETASLSAARKHLNFILIGGSAFVDRLLKTVCETDTIIGQRTLLRHFSTWLIISPDRPPHLNITLDNVALVIPEAKTWAQPIVPSLNSIFLHPKTNQHAWKNWTVAAYTLLWMPTGREWLHVAQRDLHRDSLHRILFPNTMKGLNGRQLVLVALEWLPSTKRQISNGEVKYGGAGIEIIDDLAMTFNFSYKVMEPHDMKWGDEAPDGNWSGVVGTLQREEADMCPVPYGISLARAKVMDLSYPISITEVSAVFVKREDDVFSWLFLLSCFTWEVYLCGSIAFMWTVLLLVISFYCHKRTSTGPLEIEGILQTSFHLGIHIALRQDINPRSVYQAGRILVFTWCIVCLMVAAVYTGNLVAMATMDKYKPPFTTLQGLVENTEYVVGVVEGEYTVELLRLSNDSTHRSLYEKMMNAAKERDDNSWDYNLRRFLDSKYVLLAGNSIMSILRNRTCDIVVMKESLFPLNKAFAFPRHSPLKKLFNQQIAVLSDNGLITKLETKWSPKPKECDSPFHVPQFKLDHFRIVLVACAAGILVAAMVLLVEIWKKR